MRVFKIILVVFFRRFLRVRSSSYLLFFVCREKGIDVFFIRGYFGGKVWFSCGLVISGKYFKVVIFGIDKLIVLF